jgi:hypothetical protein
MLRKRLSSVTLVLAGLAVLVGTVGFRDVGIARAADPAVEAGVTATIKGVVEAYNRADFGALLPLLTDKGFEELFFESKASALANPEFFGDQVVLRAVRSIEETDGGATATVDFESGLGIETDDMSFILAAGRWQIDGSQPGTAVVDAGTDVVDLELREFAFLFDAAAASSGNLAFNVENTGQQEHEIVLVKIDEAISLTDLVDQLASEDAGPPPFQDFGFLGYLQPGQSSTAALSHPLDAGRYAFICFVPDPADDVPHAFKGMIADFSVAAAASPASPSAPEPEVAAEAPAATAPVTLPSAGSGGSTAGDAWVNAGLALLSLALITAGLGFGLKSRP